MSPHLTIYKPQLTALLSVTHRATGIVNACVLYSIAVSQYCYSGTFPAFLMQVQELPFLGPAIIMSAKFCLAWPVCFHMLNGIRHLFWDMGYGFHMPDLYKSGYAVAALSVVLAAIVANL